MSFLRRRPALGVVVAVSFCAFGLPVRAQAQVAPQVTIEGGADATGHNYVWKITNQGGPAIIHVEFPHYHADLFFGPPGWSTKSTNLVNVGVKSPHGICAAMAESAADGITEGQSAEFKMRIAPARAPRGVGKVVVRFADDSEVVVADVELPVPPPAGDNYMSLIGLGAIFFVFLLIGAIRRRARRQRSATPD